MAKYRIFTVGLDLPGDEFEYIDFASDQTLLDADIVLFEPSLEDYKSFESYNGKPLLSEHSSFQIKGQLEHWRSEIAGAARANKLVIIYLAKPTEAYRYTGNKTYSGTGRSRVATDVVTAVSSYEVVPNLRAVTPTSGRDTRLDTEAAYLKPYWKEFASNHPYDVEIQGEFSEILIRSQTGEKIVGAAVYSSGGALLYLPPLKLDHEELLKEEEGEDGVEVLWTDDALRFGKRLLATLAAMAESLKQVSQITPPPEWTQNSDFRLHGRANSKPPFPKANRKSLKFIRRKRHLRTN